jgi:hypothetical protein
VVHLPTNPWHSCYTRTQSLTEEAVPWYALVMLENCAIQLWEVATCCVNLCVAVVLPSYNRLRQFHVLTNVSRRHTSKSCRDLHQLVKLVSRGFLSMYPVGTSTVASLTLCSLQLRASAGAQLARRLVPSSLKVGEQLDMPRHAVCLADPSRLQRPQGSMRAISCSAFGANDGPFKLTACLLLLCCFSASAGPFPSSLLSS